MSYAGKVRGHRLPCRNAIENLYCRSQHLSIRLLNCSCNIVEVVAGLWVCTHIHIRRLLATARRVNKKMPAYLAARAKSNLFTELEETGKLYRNAAYSHNLLFEYALFTNQIIRHDMDIFSGLYATLSAAMFYRIFIIFKPIWIISCNKLAILAFFSSVKRNTSQVIRHTATGIGFSNDDESNDHCA